MNRYVAIESDDSQILAKRIEEHEEEDWELVTITAFGGVFRGEEGRALFTAFMRRKA